MTMPRRFCMLLAALAATAVATAVAIGFSVASAGAAAPGLCGVVPVLCPPTTPPRTAPPTTVARVAPATTTAPTTAHAPLTPVVKKAASTAARANAPAVASVGAGGLSVNAADIGVPALASNDAAAPELAPAGAPASIRAPTPTALSGLVGAAANPLRGLPDYHSRMRIALSVLVLLVAAVAAAQLPESRRSPQRKPPAT